MAVLISYLLKGKIKKLTREEIEEKQFGKNNKPWKQSYHT